MGRHVTSGKVSVIAADSRFLRSLSRRAWLFGTSGALAALRASPADARVDPRIDALAASLSLEKKLGQLLMIGVSGTEMTPETRSLLGELDPGAVILLGRNVREPKQLAALNASLQDGAAIPRFIAMDQEGGIVVRLSRGATVFPGAMATGATGSSNLAYLEG
ncbi:MAG TPA: glycoside hydrolase family 3 N-terminal domain-containing protein, partial [Actinomycetota bacterium]|nr:glycoside hydrolase family 3 N-terminal domain-containing protein [Actinomycetota bacterium]